uniref:NADH dehydrogenase [ubiquinone] 1 alpha subcomplex assembly factor 4 n=1 Tax=Geotrypetes seraphini TaxID=260995 RepID=A0A6P8QYI5_GEOSA|nr:NADH dehydrogenase [ubiquinone] 1 alpha subcomplex assembly factor 4 [Geotrypetes seraphini]
MGARVSRALRNFNLESRAHREIGREKPASAPRHPSSVPGKPNEIQEEIAQKNNHLLLLLKDVYVASADPPMEVKSQSNSDKQIESRVPKMTFKYDAWGIMDPTSIPKGKLSVVEALSALSNHKNSPETWTAEKIAEEYILEVKDVKALLEFFIPFDLKLIPPKDAKQMTST